MRMLNHAPATMTFSRTMKQLGLIPGKKHPIPLTTPMNWEASDNLVNWIVRRKRWTIPQYHSIVFADEFYLKLSPGVNRQNYRVWYERGHRTQEVESKLSVPKPKHSMQIGFCLLLSTQGIKIIIKERGESWNQLYFQETLIPKLDDILSDPDFVEYPGNMLLIHDNCPGWRAGGTQNLLRDRMARGIFRTLPYHGTYGSWPGARPDLNPAEEAIAITKDRVWVQTIRKGTKNSKLEDELYALSRRYHKMSPTYVEIWCLASEKEFCFSIAIEHRTG